MPLYEYECPSCGGFELIRKFSDAPLAQCPTCGAAVQKLLSAPAFQFKGTGWYVTDYAKKSGGPGGGAEGTQSESTGAKSESKDSKPDAKPSAASSKPSD